MCGLQRNEEERGRGKEMNRKGGRKRKKMGRVCRKGRNREDGRKNKVEEREVEERRKRGNFSLHMLTYADKHIKNFCEFC